MQKRVFGLAGWSGSGKTTLLTALIPVLIARGFRVATIKHAHHDFDIDKPGKDSYRHREAGAAEVLVVSGKRWALMHELRDEAEPTLEALVARLAPVDLVLIEGFKRHQHPKLEIHRPSVGKPLLAPDDPDIIAIASDAPLKDTELPVLSLNDFAAIANLVIERALALAAFPA